MQIFFSLLSFLLISIFTLSFHAFMPKAALAKDHSPTIGETFVGETLLYDIGFWFFERVATAKLTLAKEEGGYKAVLSARTMGFVDRVIQHREDIYTAHLREVEGGQRFETVSLESTSEKNGKIRRGIKEVDRKAGVLKKHSWGGGKDERSGTVSFTPGSYVDDPLGGFYNFRYGVYGKAAPGAEFTINTFPKEDFKTQFIKMKMGPEAEVGQKKDKFKDRGAGGPGGGLAYIARVKMSKDVFGTDLADIDIFFSSELVPLLAEARDLVFFTDVRGTLREVSKGSQ